MNVHPMMAKYSQNISLTSLWMLSYKQTNHTNNNQHNNNNHTTTTSKVCQRSRFTAARRRRRRVAVKRDRGFLTKKGEKKTVETKNLVTEWQNDNNNNNTNNKNNRSALRPP